MVQSKIVIFVKLWLGHQSQLPFIRRIDPSSEFTVISSIEPFVISSHVCNAFQKFQLETMIDLRELDALIHVYSALLYPRVGSVRRVSLTIGHEFHTIATTHMSVYDLKLNF